MTKESSKGRSPKGKTKKRKKVPRLKIFFVLTLFCAGIFYFISKYDGVDLLKDKLEQFLPKRDMKINLYFADPDSDYLSAEQRVISKAFTQEQRIAHTIKELISGPQGKLIRTTPAHTILKNVHIDSKGVVSLDFSAHLSRNHPGGSSAEITTVYSIVNTVLLNFDEVTQVKILVDGQELKTLAGHIDCSVPLSVDKGLIR